MNGKKAKTLYREAISYSWKQFYNLLGEEEWEKLTYDDIKTTTYNYNRAGPYRKVTVTLSPPCPRYYYKINKKIFKLLKQKKS